MSQRHSPIFTDTFDLAEWLLARLGEKSDPLSKSICDKALGSLQAVTLALRGRRREDHLEDLDESLIALRVLLRLAERRSLLSREQMLFALERADNLGRQLGGWLKSLELA